MRAPGDEFTLPPRRCLCQLINSPRPPASQPASQQLLLYWQSNHLSGQRWFPLSPPLSLLSSCCCCCCLHRHANIGAPPPPGSNGKRERENDDNDDSDDSDERDDDEGPERKCWQESDADQCKRAPVTNCCGHRTNGESEPSRHSWTRAKEAPTLVGLLLCPRFCLPL